ncbi:MAG: ATP-binding protein, partial [Gemmatimonadaceae bacterium]
SAVARTLDSPRVRVLVEHPEELPLVRGYHDALSRALTNIVLNAIDACPDGGTVTIAVAQRWHERRAMVELRVRDTGAGIPPDQIESIWQPYVTSKPGGTGLGLAIVRQTILAHHGFVSASSAVGEGTEITMALPLDGNPAETVEPAVEEE